MLVYGVSGYTGRLVVEALVGRGLAPVLAGRDPERVRAVAEPAGLEWRAFPVDRPELKGVDAVVNLAGPFSRTALPLARACAAAGLPYLDVTGELPVFDALLELDASFRAAGVACVPGVGFEVAVGDALAAELAARLPGATALELFLAAGGPKSRGSQRSVVAYLGACTEVVRGGVRVRHGLGTLDRAGHPAGGVGVALPLGHLVTARRTGGYAEVSCWVALPGAARLGLRLAGWMGKGLRPFAEAWVRMHPEGPDPAARARVESVVWARATDGRGGEARLRLRAGDGYGLTAALVAEALPRARAAPAGFQSPSLAFGTGWVERHTRGFEGWS